MDNRSATSSTCGGNPNGRPQSYASAMAKLDKVTAERDRLAQKLDDEPDSKKYARDLTYLISSYYAATESADQRALISNLGGLLQQAGSTIDALTREIGHYAAAEATACEERDELRSALVEFAPDSELAAQWTELRSALVEFAPDSELAAQWTGGVTRFVEAFRAAQAEAMEPDEVIDAEVHCTNCGCTTRCGCGRELYSDEAKYTSGQTLWYHRDDHSPISGACAHYISNTLGGVTCRCGGMFDDFSSHARNLAKALAEWAPPVSVEDLADRLMATRADFMSRGAPLAELDLVTARDLLADYRITKK